MDGPGFTFAIQRLLDALAVFGIGALVGLGELISRYRDEPRRAVSTAPAMLYVGINGIASVVALVALWSFNITIGSGSPEGSRLLTILAAGFGAMAIFRTALFRVTVGDEEIGVGPVAFLDIILGATDREVDRRRAKERAPKVVAIMATLPFTIMSNPLPTFAMTLLQNLEPERQTLLANQINKLTDPTNTMPDEAKSLILGLLLMNEVGEDVLKASVDGLVKSGLGGPGAATGSAGSPGSAGSAGAVGAGGTAGTTTTKDGTAPTPGPGPGASGSPATNGGGGTPAGAGGAGATVVTAGQAVADTLADAPGRTPPKPGEGKPKP
jgi:hypothetical protein